MPAKRPRRAPTGLTEREKRFIAEYLRDLNGRQAAMRVGYAESGAASQARRLLAHEPVAAQVEKANAARSETRRITADRVMEELGRMAFSNMRDYVEWGPDGMTLRDHALLDEDQTAAVADVEPKGNGKLARLKLYDKLAALNALARHLGMIGGKTALSAARHDNHERRDANAILRERLLKIAKEDEKK
jgi:phage terminase small subunit